MTFLYILTACLFLGVGLFFFMSPHDTDAEDALDALLRGWTAPVAGRLPLPLLGSVASWGAAALLLWLAYAAR